MDECGWRYDKEELEYLESHTPINEGCQRTKAVDFLPLNEVIERGIGVDADMFLKNLREELKRNK